MATEDITIVAEAADGSEVEAVVDTHHPDVVLMDIRMPRMDGSEATERPRRRQHAPEVIVLTTFDTDEHALRTGGFLLKDTPPAPIVQVVRRVTAGEPILSPTATRQLITHLAESDAELRRRRTRARQAERRDRRRALH